MTDPDHPAHETFHQPDHADHEAWLGRTADQHLAATSDRPDELSRLRACAAAMGGIDALERLVAAARSGR